jgi:hypothetical protein
MDLGITTTRTGGSNQTPWGSRHGLGNGQSRTLDVTKFVAGTHYDPTTGVIPQVTGLGKITASGLYGPFDSTATDGRQVLDSFLLNDEPLYRPDRTLPATVIVAAVTHCSVHQNLLPVVAQRTTVVGASTTGLFTFQD